MNTNWTTESSDVVLRGLERWDRWLQETLAPAILRLSNWPGSDEHEFLWKVDYPLGFRSDIRIPIQLVEAAAGEFETVAGRFGEAVLTHSPLPEREFHR